MMNAASVITPSSSQSTCKDSSLAGRQPPVNPQLSVLLCDPSRGLLIVNKPFDLRLDGDFDFTVEKLALKLVNAPFEYKHERGVPRLLWFPHRLDYATSGILAIGTNKQASSLMASAFERRNTRKRYLAVVRGRLPIGEWSVIDAPIAPSPLGNDDFRMYIGTVENPGRASKTSYVALRHGIYHSLNGKDEDVTKLLLLPESGRRHQLRLHTLSIGHPIVGDATYTDDEQSCRMMLHAWRLRLDMKPPLGVVEVETSDPFSDKDIPISWIGVEDFIVE